MDKLYYMNIHFNGNVTLESADIVKETKVYYKINGSFGGIQNIYKSEVDKVNFGIRSSNKYFSTPEKQLSLILSIT